MEENRERDEISLANYFAVDILENIFNNSTPNEEEINRLEHELESQYSSLVEARCSGCQNYALVVSSNTVERNAVALMLKHFGFQVTFVTNQGALLEQHQKKYQIVIISENFKETGFNMLVAYFRETAEENQPLLIYLGNELASSFVKMGFDAHLKSPFFFSDLMGLLPENLKGQS